MDTSCRKYNLIVSMICVVVLGVLLFTSFFNETWQITNNDTSPIAINIAEGNYNVKVNYTSTIDAIVTATVTSHGDEHVIWAGILPQSESGYIEMPMEMTFSVYNKSLRFHVGEGAIVSSINVERSRLPYEQLLVFAFYLILSVFIYKFGSVFFFNRTVINWVCYSAVYLMMYKIFTVNIIMLLLFAASTIGVILLKKESINNEDIKSFLYIFTVSMFVMLFFTSSSMLYPYNVWTDQNIYYAMGRGMAHGKQLYTEIFDHKGPFFFGMWAIGYFISPEEYYGDYLIEAFLMALSFYCIHKIASYFVSEKASYVVSGLSMPFYLNSGFMGRGGSCEQMMVPFYLLSFCVLMPLFTSDESKKQHTDKIFYWLGFFASVVFFSKYNISFSCIFISVPAFIILLRNGGIKRAVLCALRYLVGGLINFAWIVVYFKGDAMLFIERYLLFNFRYGGVASIQDSIDRIISRVYEKFEAFPLSVVLFIIGFVGIIFVTKVLNVYGMISVIGSFIVLVGVTYPGLNQYSYYYSVVASYAFWGIIIVMVFVESLMTTQVIDLNGVLFATLCAFFMTFLVNDTFYSTIFLQREPYPQDVFANEMKLISPNDTSFFEVGMLEWGFVSQAKADPYVQYFFYPSVHEELVPEVGENQLAYIQNKVTEFVVAYGFDVNEDPDTPYLMENYHMVSKMVWHPNTGECFYLLQRNH